MSTPFSRSTTVIAIIIIILVAFYAGTITSRPAESNLQTGSSTSTVSTATDTSASQTPKVPATTKTPTPSPLSYTPILTRIAVTTRGNTTILKCTGVQLSATGFDQKGAVMAISPVWSLSDNVVATVNGSGGVISKNVGKVTAIASSGGISGSIPITVIVSAGRGNASPCPGPRR